MSHVINVIWLNFVQNKNRQALFLCHLASVWLKRSSDARCFCKLLRNTYSTVNHQSFLPKNKSKYEKICLKPGTVIYFYGSSVRLESIFSDVPSIYLPVNIPHYFTKRCHLLMFESHLKLYGMLSLSKRCFTILFWSVYPREQSTRLLV